MNDLDKSGLPLLIPRGSTAAKHIGEYPGEWMPRILQRIKMVTLEGGGGIPNWVLEMYAIESHKTYLKELIVDLINAICLKKHLS